MSRPKTSKQNLFPKLSKPIKQIPAKKAKPIKTKAQSPAITIDTKTQKQFKSLVELVKRKLSGQPKSSMPRDVKPMLASITDAPFNSEDWQFEIK